MEDTVVAIALTNFKICGLHGRTNVDIDIRDDKIILVGVNGLGKTTIINILYFFLTRQWDRLSNYDFESLSLGVGDERVELSNEVLRKSRSKRHQGFHLHIQELVSELDLFDLAREAQTDPKQAGVLIRALGLPRRYVHEWLASMPVQLQPTLFDDGKRETLEDISKRLAFLFPAQVLYLPTYRRIERDLKALFPGMEDDIEKYRRRRRMEHIRRPQKEIEHIEFVEFGMEDVQELLSAALGKLREGARAAVNNLATTYLTDVIHDRTRKTNDEELVKRLLAADMDRVLGRVDDKTMTAIDKQQLLQSIQEISPGAATDTTNQKYVAHFLSKLLDVHQNLTERESQVTRFVQVSNTYLRHKHLVFDESTYEVRVELTDKSTLELSQLSSGEKQIVSLFSQIFLGGDTPLMVLMDEPELSLSVEWQKQLLPDILQSSRCEFLAAVTHSPFIFTNELDQYAVDIAGCLSTR